MFSLIYEPQRCTRVIFTFLYVLIDCDEDLKKVKDTLYSFMFCSSDLKLAFSHLEVVDC